MSDIRPSVSLHYSLQCTIFLYAQCALYIVCIKYAVSWQEEDQELPEEDQKGVEMEADFDGTYEDVPEQEGESGDEEDGDEERLQEEMGDVGDKGDTVDERLWNEDDKPEEDQQGPEKYEKNSAVQVFLSCILCLNHGISNATVLNTLQFTCEKEFTPALRLLILLM